MSTKRIPELDGMRAVAIVLVVGCHYPAFATALGGLPEFGWIGVDIFFVLSGYLITSVLLGLKNDERRYSRFYSRRCLRILPPLALALAAIGFACAVTGDRGSFFSTISLFKNAFFLQSFGNPGFLLHPHLPSLRHAALPPGSPGISGGISEATSPLWSLSIEEYFYLLWAPVVLCLERRTVLRLGVLICAGELAMRLLFFRGRPDYFSIYMRFDALIYGAFVALLFEELRGRLWIYRAAMATSVAGIAAILWQLRPVVGFEIRDSLIIMAFGLPLMSVFVAGWIGLLVSRPVNVGAIAWLLRASPVQGLGRISYTAYLTHVLVYLCMVRFLGINLEAAILAAAGTVCVAIVSWYLMESPLLTGQMPAFLARKQAVEVVGGEESIVTGADRGA